MNPKGSNTHRLIPDSEVASAGHAKEPLIEPGTTESLRISDRHCLVCSCPPSGFRFLQWFSGLQWFPIAESELNFGFRVNETHTGNQTNQPPHSRACLVEIDFITNQNVEINSISGRNAIANRAAIIDSLAEAIVEDIEHQE